MNIEFVNFTGATSFLLVTFILCVGYKYCCFILGFSVFFFFLERKIIMPHFVFFFPKNSEINAESSNMCINTLEHLDPQFTN